MKKLIIFLILALFSGLCFGVNVGGTGEPQTTEITTTMLDWLLTWWPF